MTGERRGRERGKDRKEERKGERKGKDTEVLFCNSLCPPNSKTQYLWDPSLRGLFAWVHQGDQ